MFRLNGYIAPLYTCPMCQQSFETFNEATECIKNHVIPITIESFYQIENFGPQSIIVTLSNGHQGIYVFMKMVGENQ